MLTGLNAVFSAAFQIPINTDGTRVQITTQADLARSETLLWEADSILFAWELLFQSSHFVEMKSRLKCSFWKHVWCVCAYAYFCVCKGRSSSKKWFKARTLACMHGVGDVYCGLPFIIRKIGSWVICKRRSSSVWHLVDAHLPHLVLFWLGSLTKCCGIWADAGCSAPQSARRPTAHFHQDSRGAVSNVSPLLQCSSQRIMPWFYLEKLLCFPWITHRSGP